MVPPTPEPDRPSRCNIDDRKGGEIDTIIACDRHGPYCYVKVAQRPSCLLQTSKTPLKPVLLHTSVRPRPTVHAEIPDAAAPAPRCPGAVVSSSLERAPTKDMRSSQASAGP